MNDDQPAARPARVHNAQRIFVNLPFSNVRVQQPVDELVELTDLVARLARAVAGSTTSPELADVLDDLDDLKSRLER